jgi:hypothetical protein
MKRAARLTALFLALGLPGALRADWLVTTEGGRVETRGPWEVKGKLVVFTSADGTLASLRAAQVDLEASRRATAEAKEALAEAARAPEPAPRKAVRSITDKDVSHPGDKAADATKAGTGADAANAANAADTAGDKAADAKASTAGKSPVSVATWQKVDRAEKDGIDVVGTLQNGGGDLQTDVTLSVTLVDDGGGTLGTARATLGADSIPAKETTDFKVSFPGVFTFARAKFDIESAGLKLTIVPGAKPADDGKTASPPADQPN